MTHHPSRSTLCPFAYDFTDELTDVEEKSFARGAFSFVYRGKVKDKEVAIKVIRSNSCLEVPGVVPFYFSQAVSTDQLTKHLCEFIHRQCTMNMMSGNTYGIPTSCN